ncbi:GerMN domain-containing protein [Peptostreptococcus canis]|uniref:GerMN domain-containing protein n=1 Tax=Peptostreptococcus canis TaxID=1159213 RepID=A0ABR6TNV8_9FIRM|nr:GerMN domain-containing protein [Peptostreptococcus canis]MBC2576671.1 GerMN domain-containing protein [Peptostreptococcus canis]MBP1998579.1 hypothetical protein [Peptostreptococcus canis]
MIKRKIIATITIGLLVSSSLIGCSKIDNSSSSKDDKKQNQSVETDNKNSNDNEDKDKESKERKSEDKNSQTDKKTVEITYYTYDINSEELTEHKKKVDDLSVGNIIKELIKENVLQEGTDVNKAKVEEIDGVRTLIVDVNGKFVNSQLGSTAESLMLQSFTNSVIKTFKVKQVKLTVDGKNYSSGHIYIEDNEYLTYK